MLLLIDNPAEGIFHVSALGKVFEIKRGRVFDDFSFVHHNHAGGKRFDLLHNRVETTTRWICRNLSKTLEIRAFD